jgi:hypothetical protein
MEDIPRRYVDCKLPFLPALRRTTGSSRSVTYSVKAKTLQLAAKKLGGSRKLRDYLRAPSAEFVSWLSGIEEPPTAVFLRALELILDDLDSLPNTAEKKR